MVVTEAGCGRMSAVIALRDPLPGDARKAMFAAWAAVNLLKNVVVVDADIDPLDPLRVTVDEANPQELSVQWKAPRAAKGGSREFTYSARSKGREARSPVLSVRG